MKKSKLQYASMTRGEKIFGWIYLVFQLALPYLLKLLNGYLPSPMSAGTLVFVEYLVSFIFIICIFAKFLRNSLTAAWRDIWNFIQAVVLGFVAYFVCSKLLDWVISLLIPGYSPLGDSAISALSGSHAALRIIGIVILSPVIQETLYRGLVYRNIWRKNKVLAYVISMLIFAAVHTIGYIGTQDFTTLLLCFLRYLPAGLCLAWTYSKADNVFAPIIVHAVVNAITIGIVTT